MAVAAVSVGGGALAALYALGAVLGVVGLVYVVRAREMLRTARLLLALAEAHERRTGEIRACAEEFSP